MQKYNQIDPQESFKRGPRAFFIILCFHYKADNSFNNNCPYYLLNSIYRPQGSDWPCYRWIWFEWNWNVDSPTSQPVLWCTFLASNEDTNYYGTRLTQQCNIGGKTGLKWTCFNTRVERERKRKLHSNYLDGRCEQRRIIIVIHIAWEVSQKEKGNANERRKW